MELELECPDNEDDDGVSSSSSSLLTGDDDDEVVVVVLVVLLLFNELVNCAIKVVLPLPAMPTMIMTIGSFVVVW